MEIKVREVCVDCQGAGIIEHPAWKSFWAAHPNWWIEQSAAGVTSRKYCMSRWFAREGYLDLPEQELPCPSCEGAGWREEWIDLLNAVNMAFGNHPRISRAAKEQNDETA